MARKNSRVRRMLGDLVFGVVLFALFMLGTALLEVIGIEDVLSIVVAATVCLALAIVGSRVRVKRRNA